jgi:hypothetical protein
VIDVRSNFVKYLDALKMIAFITLISMRLAAWPLLGVQLGTVLTSSDRIKDTNTVVIVQYIKNDFILELRPGANENRN